jgi:hypothetical protein
MMDNDPSAAAKKNKRLEDVAESLNPSANLSHPGRQILSLLLS